MMGNTLVYDGVKGCYSPIQLQYSNLKSDLGRTDASHIPFQ